MAQYKTKFGKLIRISEEPLMIIAFGKKFIGKTHKTKEAMMAYIMGDKKTGAMARKSLILDANDEFSDIKSLMIADIPEWCSDGKIEVRRVRIFDADGRRWSLDEIAGKLSEILQVFWGGLLLVEDPTKYISDSLPNDLVGAICTQRHADCDVIIHFQTIGKIAHPKLWGNANLIRGHKAEDTVKKHEPKFQADITGLFLLEALIQIKYEAGDERFCSHYDKDNMVVRGEFTVEDFEKAIRYYLEYNANAIKKEFERIDLDSGNKKYASQKEVIDFMKKDLMQKYYGNPK